MTLTPLDLQQKSFRKVRFGGIDEAQVHQYLEEVASELEETRRRLDRQDEELRRRESRIAEFKEREHLLQQTLTTAQKLSEEMKESSRKEAEIVMTDAELQAEKIIANAQAKRLALIQEIDELKRAKAAFLQGLSALIDSHKALVDQVRGQDNASQPPPVSDNVSFLAPPVAKKK